MAQIDLLRRVVRALEDSKVEFMLTGSFASSLQGEPRSTHDIDIVVELSSAQANRLFGALEDPALYLSRDAAMDAVTRGTRDAMFNVLDTTSSDKMDFWLLSDDPFDHSRFARRQPIEFEGMHLYVSAPEDTILMKLRWAKQSGGSQRQMNDAIGIYSVRGDELDQSYLDQWAARLDVQELLDEVRASASQ